MAEVAALPVPDDVTTASSGEIKDEWVKKQIKASNPDKVKYAGRFFCRIEGEKPAGYVVEGVTLGFKNWVRFFMAIDSAYTIQGVEIIEHEEDPGLRAEIVQRYFKNQFAGRSFEDIEKISVTKTHCPRIGRLLWNSLATCPSGPG